MRCYKITTLNCIQKDAKIYAYKFIRMECIHIFCNFYCLRVPFLHAKIYFRIRNLFIYIYCSMNFSQKTFSFETQFFILIAKNLLVLFQNSHKKIEKHSQTSELLRKKYFRSQTMIIFLRSFSFFQSLLRAF